MGPLVQLLVWKNSLWKIIFRNNDLTFWVLSSTKICVRSTGWGLHSQKLYQESISSSSFINHSKTYFIVNIQMAIHWGPSAGSYKITLFFLNNFYRYWGKLIHCITNKLVWASQDFPYPFCKMTDLNLNTKIYCFIEIKIF